MSDDKKSVTQIIKQSWFDCDIALILLIGILSILFAGTPDLADAIMYYLTDGTFPSIEVEG